MGEMFPTVLVFVELTTSTTLLVAEVEEILIVLLEKEERALSSDGFLCWGRLALGCFPVSSESRGGDVGLATGPADERSLVVVEAFVKLQVDKLGEAERTFLTGEWFLSFVKSHVRLQV